MVLSDRKIQLVALTELVYLASDPSFLSLPKSISFTQEMSVDPVVRRQKLEPGQDHHVPGIPDASTCDDDSVCARPVTNKKDRKPNWACDPTNHKLTFIPDSSAPNKSTRSCESSGQVGTVTALDICMLLGCDSCGTPQIGWSAPIDSRGERAVEAGAPALSLRRIFGRREAHNFVCSTALQAKSQNNT